MLKYMHVTCNSFGKLQLQAVAGCFFLLSRQFLQAALQSQALRLQASSRCLSICICRLLLAVSSGRRFTNWLMSLQWDSAADALQWAPWTPWAIVEQRLEVNGNLHDDVDVRVASSASACAARMSTPPALEFSRHIHPDEFSRLTNSA